MPSCVYPDPATDDCYGAKTEWPEVVGLEGYEAAYRITKENKWVDTIEFMVRGMDPPSDFCCNRVLLYLEHLQNGRVVQSPKVG